MSIFNRLRSTRLALSCAVALVLPQGLGAQTPPPAAPKSKSPAQQPAQGVSAAPTATADIGWPRTYTTDAGTIVLYQPQIASWDAQAHIVAWSAVSYEAKAEPQAKEKPRTHLGTIKIEADTEVALEDRLVRFNDFETSEVSFSTLSRDDTRAVVERLRQAMPASERVIALDRVLAAVDRSAIRPKDTPGVKSDPPMIFTSTKPAILLNIDGPTVWNPIKNLDLEYAVNTNWDLFRYTPSNTLYLLNGKTWLQAPAVEGPWSPAGKLPPSFKKLPEDGNFTDVKPNVPGKSVSEKSMPTVFFSSGAAELVLFTGQPVYQAVPGTSLFWLSNTESDIFRLGKTGAFYYLVAGRWFSAADLAGPWTFATPNLPDDFRKIPVEHARSRVLASVPGTDQANEAVLLSQIPQTARVNRKTLAAPEVVYQGEPQFQPIENTSLQRAVNTDKDIVKLGSAYYMCFQGVWFVGSGPSGPWEVAILIPDEIYKIPTSSPAHSVTYVKVEQSSSNDDWVTFAYVAGYTGMMVAWGCAVWGTGWYYPPYVWGGGYYGYPRTYGVSAWYNPYTGNYGRAGGVYGPYGGVTAGAVYNPRTGTYARGASAYGPYGSRSAAQAYNPRTGTYAQTRQGSNVYGNWGSSSVQRGDDWARTGHVTNRATGTTTRGFETSGGAAGISRNGDNGRTSVGRAGNGDVYAGHDGNVYRKQGESWQQWNGDGWSSSSGTPGGTARPGTIDTRPNTLGAGVSTSGTVGQLNNDSRARQDGATRTQDTSTYRSSPSRTNTGSYRGGGGGGGARRR